MTLPRMVEKDRNENKLGGGGGGGVSWESARVIAKNRELFTELIHALCTS